MDNTEEKVWKRKITYMQKFFLLLISFANWTSFSALNFVTLFFCACVHFQEQEGI